MDEHEEARKIDLHDAKLCLQHDSYLGDLNLLVVELQARIVGPQQLHVVMAAEDAQGNETVISLTYHGSFTVWWVDWSPDLEAYEEEDDGFDWEVPPLSVRCAKGNGEKIRVDGKLLSDDQEDWIFGHCAPDIPEKENDDANDHPV